MKSTWFITGNDTGVGKTVLTVLLARYLEQRSLPFLAIKPFCSGGRSDAQCLFQAQQGRVSLDQINPWHFRAPLSPSIAAARERTSVALPAALHFLQNSKVSGQLLLIEGAGGLLSPLGPDYCARDLIERLHALPLVVCTNRLGVINQARLVWEALPRRSARVAKLILMDPDRKDPSSRSNATVLGTYIDPARICRIPWLPDGMNAPLGRQLTRTLDSLVH